MKVKYVYIRRYNPRNPSHRGDPVACIASTVVTQNGKRYINYGTSILREGDQFNRSLARKISGARLEKSPRQIELNDTVFNHRRVQELIMSDIMLDRLVPRKIRNLADDWLRGKNFEKQTAAKLAN